MAKKEYAKIFNYMREVSASDLPSGHVRVLNVLLMSCGTKGFNRYSNKKLAIACGLSPTEHPNRLTAILVKINHVNDTMAVSVNGSCQKLFTILYGTKYKRWCQIFIRNEYGGKLWELTNL